MNTTPESPAAGPHHQARLKLVVRGAVQGIGFRPFVYRLATALGLTGWVGNSSQGVDIEAEGERAALEEFLLRLEPEKPAHSFIQSLETAWLMPVGHAGFEIRDSAVGGEQAALVMPDLATCPDCLREVLDPANRRHLYPFTNCTNCGPRFSIIESLPYDRRNTTMKAFAMCARCQAEYSDPADRRFHAQPNACPDCGPQLEFWDSSGRRTAVRHEALLAAAAALRSGRIVAVKGLGGFHLLTSAHDDAAVGRLRNLKRRGEKPFAVMFPSLEAVIAECEVCPLERRLLSSAEAPIVLLRRKLSATRISSRVAPGNPNLGALLPYTPLHHLLLRELGFPVVATSGNLSEEPICIDEEEAVRRLGAIADDFLVHNRPIVRAVDDSVVRLMLGREMLLRRARGYAPLPIALPQSPARSAEHRPRPILAVGAQLKNTVALGLGDQVFLTQHLGDLENLQTYEAFLRAVEDLQNLFQGTATDLVSDAHPDYLSAKFAADFLASRPGVRGLRVQHHEAHVLACMADNELTPPVLGVAWDGTGFGPDGSVWGGEFFFATPKAMRRVAHFRQFRLPGGEQAMREPRRAALGLLWEIFGDDALSSRGVATEAAFCAEESAVLATALKNGLNSPLTSSAGRLFDAVASLIGRRQINQFEGQAAMELEFLAEGCETADAYAIVVANAHGQFEGPVQLDWQPMIEGILADLARGVAPGMISAKFHNALAESVILVARRLDVPQVALTGGCFQNRRLLERCATRLAAEGYRPFWHQRVPPNDGGIALGQVLARMRTEP